MLRSLLPIGLALAASLALLSCGADQTPNQTPAKSYSTVEGETMGTYYRVTFQDTGGTAFKPLLDSVLERLNLEVSTYIPQATISRFNRTDSVFNLRIDPVSGNTGQYPNEHFLANYQKALEVYSKTGGYFDPTVMPLVNYWGFGYTEKKEVEQVDSALVDSLRQLVGMNLLSLENYENGALLRKATPTVQLDFSAIAKGYGVDLLGRLLESKGVYNYLIDIGGETLAKGLSPRGDLWMLGISRPEEGAEMDDIQVKVPLDNQALATSGNYRNFYEVNGQKYSHTINPKTGYPERNTLLSASVFAADCTTADAYATAFMTMGLERALALAEELPALDAYFIYSLPGGGMAVKHTDGLKAIFQNTNQQ